MLALAAPISALLRNRPEDLGLQPDGGTPPAAGGRAAAARAPDMTAGQALRTPAFWLIAFGHGFTSMVLLAIMSHLGLLMAEQGFQVQHTAFVVAVYTGVAMVFQLVGGFAGDRISKRVALAAFSATQAAGVLLLVLADSLAMFYVFAIVFGMGFGGRNPLTVAIRADYFGTASFGKILGLSTVPMNLLLLIASPLAGWLRDVQGDYTDAFLLLAALNLAGAVCFLTAARPRPA